MVGVAIASVSFMAACGDGGTDSKGDVYPLVSVNGSSLPYDDGFGDVMKGGSLSLLSGNRFAFKVNGTYTDPDLGAFNYSSTASGTYVLDAATGDITFTSTRSCYSAAGQSECEDYPNDPTIVVGSKDGTTITVTDPDYGYDMVFSK